MQLAVFLSILVHLTVLTTVSPPLMSQHQSEKTAPKSLNESAKTQQRNIIQQEQWGQYRKILIAISQEYLRHEKAIQFNQKGQVQSATENLIVLISQLTGVLGSKIRTEDSLKTIQAFDNWFPFFTEILLSKKEGTAVQLYQVIDEIKKLNDYLDSMDLKYEHYRLTMSSLDAEPEWLTHLNYRRKSLHDYLSKNYSMDQPSLLQLLISKKGNALAEAYLYFAIFQERLWLKDIPNHKIGFRIFNDFIEPVLIVHKNPPLFTKDLIFNLHLGTSNYLGEEAGNVYKPAVRYFALLNFLNVRPPLLKNELLLYQSVFPAQRVFVKSEVEPFEAQLKMNILGELSQFKNQKIEILEGIYQNSNFNFGPEIYDFSKQKPLNGQLVYFPLRILHSKVLAQKKRSSIPSEEQSENVINKSLEKVLGKKQESTTDEQIIDQTKSMMEIAQQMAESQGNTELQNQIQKMDPELLTKINTESEEGRKSRTKQLQEMARIFEMVADRKLQNGDSPDFVADPKARLATDLERQNEFHEFFGFLVKVPTKENLKLWLEKSQKFHNVKQGFRYRIIHPEREIIFRTQSEVDNFNSLSFQDKFQKLVSHSLASEDAILNKSKYNRFLAYMSQILNSKDMEGPSFTSFDLKDLVHELDLLSSVFENMNQSMKYIFRRASLFPNHKSIQGGLPYMYTESFEKLLSLVINLEQSILKDPLAFLSKIDHRSDRQEVLKFLIVLKKWTSSFVLTLQDPPTESINQSFKDTWKSLTKYWNRDIFKILKINSEDIFKEQIYNPDSLELDDYSDIFSFALLLLPTMVSENRIQIGEESKNDYKCHRKERWVELPQADWGLTQAAHLKGYKNLLAMAEKEGQKCIVTYTRWDEYKKNDVNIGKYVVTTLGRQVIKKEPYIDQPYNSSSSHIKQQRRIRNRNSIMISPETFLGLILALPNEQLSHPLVQIKALKRIDKIVFKVLEDQFGEVTFAPSILALFSLPAWWSLVSWQEQFPQLDVKTFWNKNFDSAQGTRIRLNYTNDPIQNMNRNWFFKGIHINYPKKIQNFIVNLILKLEPKGTVDIQIEKNLGRLEEQTTSTAVQQALTDWKNTFVNLSLDPMYSFKTSPISLTTQTAILSIRNFNFGFGVRIEKTVFINHCEQEIQIISFYDQAQDTKLLQSLSVEGEPRDHLCHPLNQNLNSKVLEPSDIDVGGTEIVPNSETLGSKIESIKPEIPLNSVIPKVEEPESTGLPLFQEPVQAP